MKGPAGRSRRGLPAMQVMTRLLGSWNPSQCCGNKLPTQATDCDNMQHRHLSLLLLLLAALLVLTKAGSDGRLLAPGDKL
jgi:hypothetical protein